MDGATIQARMYAGRAKAALKIGFDCLQYRPSSPSNPLATSLATLKAAFNSGDNTYTKPNLYGDPVWFGDFDGRITMPGDYLVRNSDGQIFFIAAQQPLLPIVCIDCNRTIRISRAAAPASAIGAVGYSGICDAPAESNDLIGINPANNGGVFVGWPCSIVYGKGRMKNSAALPSSTSEQMGWRILLPPSVPVQIQTSDRVIDDSGRSFVVNGAEKTDLGWRITAIEVHT